MEDIIDRYVSIVSEFLDAPEVFIKASAYHIVSALLGRFFHCSNIPGFPRVGLRPNLWFILSSIPGRTRRSTVMNYTNHVYDRAMRDFFNNPNFDFGSKNPYELVLDTLIEEGTPEGIMDHIHATRNILDCYVITSPEFGSILTAMNTKEHQQGVSTLLSKLYYGEGGSVRLSKRNKEAPSVRYLPPNKYFNMFCSMQEPKYYLTPIMLRQGLLRRILLFYCKTSDITRWVPPIYNRTNIYNDLSELADDMSAKMFEFWNLCRSEPHGLIETNFGGLVTGKLNGIALENDQKLVKEENSLRIYKQSFWEHLTKLSIISAISRDNLKSNRSMLFVTQQDVDRSEVLLNEGTKYTNEIISTLSQKDLYIPSAEEPLERVFNIVAENETIDRSVLYRKSKMQSSFLEEMLTTLLRQERIKVERIPTGGRVKVVYHLAKS